MTEPEPIPANRDPLEPAESAMTVLLTEDDVLAPVVEAALARAGMACRRAGTTDQLAQLVSRQGAPVIVLADDTQAQGGQLAGGIDSIARDGCGVIVLSRRRDLEAAVDAMRGGAIDFIPWPCAPDELGARLRAGFDRLRAARAHADRVDQLERACEKLDGARREMAQHTQDLFDEVLGACDTMEDDLSAASMAGEFGALVGQELDVESLLRTTLEYMLTKTGPTNAAVFLPTGHEDYSLGAYVNCDVPRESADVLLDHLADIIAPRFEAEKTLRRFVSDRELESALGEDAGWLEGSELVVFACHDEEECIAVFALFRERRSPFTPEILSDLEVMRQIFAEQLAKVVRVHHRHLPPQDQWPGFDVEEGEDYGGLAA